MKRFLLAAALLLAVPAFGAQPYLTGRDVDLLTLLPPPPVNDPAGMAVVLELQKTRTPDRIARALADVRESVFDMYGPVLGPRFDTAALPLTTALFDRLGDTEEVVSGPAKDGFGRKRPFLANPEVHPAIPLSRSASYPSGHATRATMDGIVLAAMLPEQRAPLFARMAEYAQSRVVGGVHFPSDIEAGARAGTAIAAVLFHDPAFASDFGPARREVRAAVGLPE